MPKAANPFDYRTIADVVVTFDYTALASTDYRAKVIQQLNRTTTAVRSFSIRDQFPDQWYDLHNPPQIDSPLAVEITVRDVDFPTNLDEISTAQLALYLVPAEQADADNSPRIPVPVSLRLTQDGQAPVEGSATSTTDGIVSTRIGNAAAWLTMLGRSPVGTWRLAFPETEKMRELLDDEAIGDIALVITYSARLPEWPL